MTQKNKAADVSVAEVFKELAVLRGQRNADGTWNDSDEREFVKTLRNAARLVELSQLPSSDS